MADDIGVYFTKYEIDDALIRLGLDLLIKGRSDIRGYFPYPLNSGGHATIEIIPSTDSCKGKVQVVNTDDVRPILDKDVLTTFKLMSYSKYDVRIEPRLLEKSEEKKFVVRVKVMVLKDRGAVAFAI